MEFHQFEKMEQSHSKLRSVDASVNKASGVVVMEKIHGANFSVMTDGALVECARRKGMIKAGEQFIPKAQHVIAHACEAALKMFPEVAERERTLFGEDCLQMTLFGELCGGVFPGMESQGTPVQQGVYYSPKNEFFVFDVAVKNAKGEWFYLAWNDKLEETLRSHGLRCVEPLLKCPLSQALDFPVKFESTIPKRLGLEQPQLPDGRKNFAEGVVIKQEARAEASKRLILKKKNNLYSEKEYTKLKKNALDKFQATQSPEFQLCMWELLALINRPRLDSVISKHGIFSLEIEEQVLLDMVQDVFEDFQADEELLALFGALPPQDQVALRAFVKEHSEKVVNGAKREAEHRSRIAKEADKEAKDANK